MAKIIFRQKAIDDLTDIWDYTVQKWSEKQAEKYLELIKFACLEIGNNPSIGKAYVEISNHLFGLRSGKHIIFYHNISADETEVIRILHESMDLKNRITE
jgi:toxin ParE1/3/4